MVRASVDSLHDYVTFATRMFTSISLALLFFEVLIVLIITNIFSRPIIEMSRIARRMSNMDFSAKADVNTDDEIGELGESMNNMASSLEKSITELKSANLELSNDIRKQCINPKMSVDELSEFVTVGIDDIVQTVLEQETVEKVRRDDKGSRHKDPHTLPMVVQVIPLEDMVEECQATGFPAQGAVPETGEADRIIVALRFEAGHYTETLCDPVVPYGPDNGVPEFPGIVEMGILEGGPDSEQAPGKQPAGNVVLGS